MSWNCIIDFTFGYNCLISPKIYLFYPQTFMPGLWIRTLFCFFCPFGILIDGLGRRERVFVLVVHLFIGFAHIGLSLFLFLLVLGVGCHFGLWLFLYFSVYIFYFLCGFCDNNTINLSTHRLQIRSGTVEEDRFYTVSNLSELLTIDVYALIYSPGAA